MSVIDAASDQPVAVLIERAGSAVARVALQMLGGAYGRVVAVIAGPGNNGADGRVAAELLADRGVKVLLYDALAAPPELPSVDLVIDAAFGTGFRGRWVPPRFEDSSVLAVDIPTGLDALTGVAGPDTLRADRTITFAAAKPGHVLGAAKDYVGTLEVVDIGLSVDTAAIEIVERVDVASWLPRRRTDAHKWSSGVRVVAGSRGMTGAAYLVSGAANRTGAGMVTLSGPGVAANAPVEVVERPLPSVDWADDVLGDLHRYKALVVGPGLGRDDDTVPSIVRTVSESVVPVVVDGDGLFAMSWNEAGTPGFLREREVPTILTPHDREYRRLTGSQPGPDRCEAARRLSEMSGAVVLLKGATTVVAAPDGPTRLVSNGDQRLATAGTGDVLAGIIAALLAIGVPAAEAAAGGAWIHAEAAGRCAPIGMIAGDLLDSIPPVLEWCRAS